MKRILQKSFAWLVMIVAMFAVSVSAMAESVSFEYTSDFIAAHGYGYPNGFKEGPITTKPAYYEWNGTFELWDGGKEWGYLKVFPDDGYAITQVEIQASNDTHANQIFEIANKGSFNNVGSKAVWVGQETGELWFSCTGDNLYTTVTVTYETAAASTTFDFTDAFPASGDYDKAINSINLYHNNGSLEFATGKTVSDIKVNNVSLDSNTGFSSWSGGVYLGCNFAEEGTYVLTIPAGTFVGANGKTNTEFSQTYVITFPGFAMSSALWTTFCSLVPWKVPSGYKVYTVSDIENGEVVLENTYEEDSYVPMYCPVLVNGPEAEKVVITTDQYQYPNSPAKNYLYSALSFGTSERTFIASEMWKYLGALNGQETDCELFKLSYNTNGEDLGFYWDGEYGQSLTCQPNKAFLVVPVSKLGGASSNGLKIRFADEDVTGINAIATESNDVIYNLQGQRVNATKAGVYVKNGKKFIVK